jgi:hypothetical protein
LERQLTEAIETLEDWRENHDKKLREPAEEIARRLARLQEVKYPLINLHRIWQKAGILYC